MLNKLTLTNFKRHEHLVLDFAEGLSALKGANEAGKSTCYHAIAYAFFGARALPLTLAETVTYDKPESSLKVELKFTHEGVGYTIVRSKSGATLTCAAFTASGQNEVTKAVEKLFGVNADTASKIMVASQGGLRGALESGDAVPLIEKLSNLSLIDELIGKINEQLPSGNTKSLVEAISSLEDLVHPVLDTSDLLPAISFTENVVEVEDLEFRTLRLLVDSLDEKGARVDIANVVAKRQHIEQASKSLESLRVRLATPPAILEADIPALKAADLEQTQAHIVKRVYKQFLALPKVTVPTPVKLDLRKAYNDTVANLSKIRDNIIEAKVAIASSTALRITESACGLCGKDLQNVPEVVAKNEKLQKAIDLSSELLKHLEVQLSEATAEEQRFQELLKVDGAHKAFYEDYQGFVEMVASSPSQVLWVGEIPDMREGPLCDYKGLIAQAEKAEKAYLAAMAIRAELLETEKALVISASEVLDAGPEERGLELLRTLDTKRAELRAKERSLDMAKINAREAKFKLEIAQTKYATEITAYESAMANKVSLEQQLAAMQENNALVKKLREARPIVAKKLWTLVLASVSAHFSQIRGTPSRVTRNDTSFLVDGKNVMGMSGSTLDSLGLAIRMALSKTFLPSVAFLLLDEPAAGMDDEREAAMLGLLASASYKQVVVVTHSTLADSFATAILQI